MKKIDKAVEIIRGWSDEELKDFFIRNHCPYHLGIKKCEKCEGFEYDRYRCCTEGWNEEVEE